MGLDVNTLFLVTVYVEAILGLLLLFAWAQNTQIHAVAWWGCAHLLRAGSVVLFGMYGSVSEAISIDLANALLLLSFAVTWSGARVFDGRPLLPMYIVARSGGLDHHGSPAGYRRRSAAADPALLRHHYLLHLAHGLRILARPQRAAGLALAGDLHAVCARCALPAAHPARRRCCRGRPATRYTTAYGSPC